MAVTEVIMMGGERIRVDGDAPVVESAILSAARGSIMEFTWMIGAETGHRVGINPAHVLVLRELDAGATTDRR